MESLLSQLFNGVSNGSILLMAALGLAFSFGLMKVINMAHGEFIMVGAYATYVMQMFVAPAIAGEDAAKSGIFFILSIPVAFVITGVLGYLLEITLIRRLYGRPLDTLLATWGVGLILQQLARSYDSRNVPVTAPDWLNGGLALTDMLVLPYKRIFIIGLVIMCVIGLYFFLYRSSNGRRIRAVMQNREIASALGTPTRRVDSLTFALGAGLAGVAGCALTLLGQIGPQLGTGYIVDAFMVVVLGGVGSLPGTIAAAFTVGILNTFLEMSTTATLGKVLVFVFIIAFLQWRPNGLVAVRSR